MTPASGKSLTERGLHLFGVSGVTGAWGPPVAVSLTQKNVVTAPGQHYLQLHVLATRLTSRQGNISDIILSSACSADGNNSVNNASRKYFNNVPLQ